MNIDFLRKEKTIIFSSSIILFISIFLWDVKFEFFQAKYLISTLLIYNVILYEKKDIKHYLYFLSLVILFYAHISIVENKLIFDKYINLSLIFLLIYTMVLYKLHNHFEKILKYLVLFFILFINFIFLIEAFSLDFYVYDHENLVNGLCILCTKDNFTIFKFFYIENSHLSMMSVATILYSLIDFKKKSKFEKINLLFFTLINFIFFLSLTLLIGIIFSSFFVLIFGILKNFENKKLLLWPIILSLSIFLLLPNCWGRVYQIVNANLLYDTLGENNFSNKLGDSLIEVKKLLINDNIFQDKNIVLEKKKDKEKETENINKIFTSLNATTIIHLNHYMVAYNSLIEKPFGYGFQNYQKSTYEFAEKNKMVDIHSTLTLMNINDGSNNFNKMIVEFGIFNFIFLIFFFIFHFKTDLKINSKIFIFSIIVTQMFRAAGYFNGGFLFVLLTALFSIYIKQSK